MSTAERYAVISSDGHAGAELYDYRDYLASQWHDEFDAWADDLRQPVRRPPRADRVPQLGQRPPPRGDRVRRRGRRGAVPEHRPAVLRAGEPRRAAADGGGLRPPLGRPPGPQPLARRLLRRGTGPARRPSSRSSSTTSTTRSPRSAGPSENMHVLGGVLLPSVPPNSGIAPLWDPYYEPLWELCEELDVAINVHGGSGLPDYGDHEAARAIMLIELAWFAHRPVWHLIFGGVLERHPTLRVVLTEQGMAWMPAGPRHARLVLPAHDARRRGRSRVLRRGGQGHVDDADRVLPAQLLGRRELPAPERERRCATTSASTGSCGAPTTRTPRAATRTRPRRSGPRSRDVPPDEVQRMVETNAAALLRLRPRRSCAPIGDRIGPTVDAVAAAPRPRGLPGRLHLQRVRQGAGRHGLVMRPCEPVKHRGGEG